MKIENGNIQVPNEDLRTWRNRLVLCILETGRIMFISYFLAWIIWGTYFLVYGVDETLRKNPIAMRVFWSFLIFPAHFLLNFCILTYNYHKHKNDK